MLSLPRHENPSTGSGGRIKLPLAVKECWTQEMYFFFFSFGLIFKVKHVIHVKCNVELEIRQKPNNMEYVNRKSDLSCLWPINSFILRWNFLCFYCSFIFQLIFFSKQNLASFFCSLFLYFADSSEQWKRLNILSLLNASNRSFFISLSSLSRMSNDKMNATKGT